MIPQPDYKDSDGSILTVVKDTDGNFYYYKDREKQIRHRADGPAKVWKNGNEEWWYDGKLHRLDGPASTHVAGYYHYKNKVQAAREYKYYVNGEVCDRGNYPAKVLGYLKPKMVIFM